MTDFFNPLIGDDSSQSASVRESLGKDDITLIQGPPGTGKTTVIAEIILQFLKTGKSVLLTAQTNNAVDNALNCVMKWKDPAMSVARAASTEEKIVDPYIKDIWVKSKRELSELKAGCVIGATNVGTHTLGIMKGREFDVLVMDEAGKANLVESILPMLLIREKGKFVIVGDHKQGKPYAYDDDVLSLFMERAPKKNRFLIKERLNKSLFERLIEGGYKSILLKVNYRSSPEIVELTSRLFYNGGLIPAKKPPRQGKSIIIVDTSKKAGCMERKETEIEGRGYKNTHEANLVLSELREILKYRYIATGIRSRRMTGITILAPYIFQVEEIKRQISQKFAGRLPGDAMEDLLESVITIDSFQGREDEIVIISFTRSNDNPNEVGFLNELNRINVALSRAKRKMILIGDFKTLMNVRKGPNAGFIRNIFRTIYETTAKG